MSKRLLLKFRDNPTFGITVSALPQNSAKKRRCVLLLRILRFPGFLQSLCGVFHYGQFFFVHGIEHDIDLLSTGTLSIELVREKELIHGNLQQGDELIESIKVSKLGYCPRFSIYMMERGVRFTSWAKYSCVQPFSSRLRLISRPRAWKSRCLSYWYILISPYIILHFGFWYENEMKFYM